MSTPPRFAVVGHPNKGKSSIVATLSQNEQIQIAAEAGTTQVSQAYPLQVDGQTLYVLIDTPGFQRARAALAWLQSHSQDAADRPQTLRAFVTQHQGQQRFKDECELLKPLLEGAGIIYVVDGSVPYGPEYEAEMEILRWSGRPSMALINPIRSDSHVSAWQTALGQYFQTVRVFNARTAEFDKHLALLRCFGQLEPGWEAPLNQAISALEQQHQYRHQQAANLIGQMIQDALTHQIQTRLSQEQQREQVAQQLQQQWQHQLRQREQQCRLAIEHLYQHQHLQRQESELELEQPDLFATDSWYLWGLNKKEMVAVASAGGAATGLLADLGVGGSSLLLGTLGGGIVAGIGAWLFADDIAKSKLNNKALGGQQLSYGPATHPNFPFVLLGRALQHWQQLIRRNHAWREPLVLSDPPRQWLEQLAFDERKKLNQCFTALSKQAPQSLSRFNSLCLDIMQKLEKGA
ncbi:GTPase/DUF3482 domain-containing protein [Balneatrix alpica]|uniref:GTPase/DUF3482 domain-containing protein n=1 Tax=Balneatrix alpica TaxID=75684 RepID=UPI0027398D98|nr:GTPase/DUF3482 domain-containing protein [Balneatrix alpica]